MENFVKYCKNYIKDNIDGYEGSMIYLCDLADTITEGANADGSLTYSTYEAKKYIKEWWDEASEYLNYEKDNFGGSLHNPFENPEAFMVCMVITGCNTLISMAINKCGLNDKWNDSVELTGKLIKKLLSEIEKVSEDTDLF